MLNFIILALCVTDLVGWLLIAYAVFLLAKIQRQNVKNLELVNAISARIRVTQRPSFLDNVGVDKA